MTDVTLRFTGTESGLSAQFARANRSLDDLSRNVARASGAIQTGFKGITAAVAAIGLGRLINESIQFADELTKAAARTGIAVDSLQKLQFVASQADVEFGSLTNAINRLQNTLVLSEEGSDQAAKALARLGVPVEQFIALRSDQQFELVAQTIASIKDPADRTAVAIGLFGKSGAELLPVLVQTGEQLGQVNAQFLAIGGPVTADAIARVDDIGDAFGRLGTATKSLVTELLALAEPVITPVLSGLQEVARDLRILAGTADELAVLEQNLRFLREERALGVFAVGESAFNPGGGISFLTEREADAAIAAIERKRDQIIQFRALQNPSFQTLTVDPGLVPITLPFAKEPEQTVAERREQALATDNPAVTFALDEKDLLFKIEEEHLAKVLRLQEEHFLRSNQIASEAAQFRADIRELFGVQEITFEAAKAASIFDIGSGLLGALAGQNTKFAKIQQGLAIATVTYDTSRAIMAAIATLNYGAAAKAAVMGAIQIAKIRSTNYSGGSVSGGGGGFSVGGGAAASSTPLPTAPAAPVGATQGNVLRVEVIGMVTKDAARAIAEEIGAVVNSGDVVFIGANSTQAEIIRRGN